VSSFFLLAEWALVRTVCGILERFAEKAAEPGKLSAQGVQKRSHKKSGWEQEESTPGGKSSECPFRSHQPNLKGHKS